MPFLVATPDTTQSRFRKRKHSTSSSYFSTSGAETLTDEDSGPGGYQRRNMKQMEKHRERSGRRGKAVLEVRHFCTFFLAVL